MEGRRGRGGGGFEGLHGDELGGGFCVNNIIEEALGGGGVGTAADEANGVGNEEGFLGDGHGGDGEAFALGGGDVVGIGEAGQGFAALDHLDDDRIAVHDEGVIGGEGAAPVLPGGVAPALAQDLEVGGGGAEERVGEGDFAAPGGVGGVAEPAGGAGCCQQIGVIDDAAGAVAELAPAAGFAEDAAGGKLAGAEFFVVPEDVALGVVFFGEEAVDEADGFDGFTVVNGFDLDAGLGGELLEDRLGIDFVLGGVNDDDVGVGAAAAGGEEEEKEEGEEW